MKRWVLAATILGSSMAFIDTTVVNVALPVMQRELRASVSDAQWIIDAYLLVLSALILAGGSLGDRLGRIRVRPRRDGLRRSRKKSAAGRSARGLHRWMW